MKRNKTEIQTDKEPGSSDLPPAEIALTIKNSILFSHTRALLTEMTKDLLSIYHSEEYDVEHRAMVYDNYENAIKILLGNDNNHRVDDDEYLEAARVIAKNENIAYLKEHWSGKSPVEQTRVNTDELNIILNATAVSNTVEVVFAQNESSPEKSDELVAVNS